MKFILLLGFCLISCGRPEHLPSSTQPAKDNRQVKIEPGDNQIKEPIDEPQPLSFQGDVLPIFKLRCSNCHAEGRRLVFYEDYDSAFRDRELIKEQVFVFQTMPGRNNSTGMTSEERDLVAQWVDQGAAP